MDRKFVVMLAVVAAVLADQSSHVSFSLGGAPAISHSTPVTHGVSYSPAPSYHHPRPTYRPQPAYKPEPTYRPQPAYIPEPVYHPKPAAYRPEPPSYHRPEPSYLPKPAYPPKPSYHPRPSYHPQPSYTPEPAVPVCAIASGKTWCLEDQEYPTYELKHAVEQHLDKVLTLYADVADLYTANSVARPTTLEEETYLCPSETSYVKPLRARNTDGKWRVIVNNIEAHYQTLTQTTRIEECLYSGDVCPLVPKCYESKCLQKSIYHRFLVYDPYDQYFPFAIETFKLPASCACLLGAYTINH